MEQVQGEEHERDLEKAKMERGKHGNATLRVCVSRKSERRSGEMRLKMNKITHTQDAPKQNRTKQRHGRSGVRN